MYNIWFLVSFPYFYAKLKTPAVRRTTIFNIIILTYRQKIFILALLWSSKIFCSFLSAFHLYEDSVLAFARTLSLYVLQYYWLHLEAKFSIATQAQISRFMQ